MKTITFTSLKGGVAKSTSALSTASILSENYKVLLIDLDPNNSTTSHFISNIDTINNKTIHQLLKSEISIDECIIPITNNNNNLDIIPSEIELSLIEKELAGISNQFFILYDSLEIIKDYYDYCIIDTTPSMGFTTKLALISSDIIVIPSQLEKWSIRAINASLIEIEDSRKTQKYIDKKIDKITILPTFYEENRVVKSAYLDLLKEQFPNMVSDNLIHTSTEISKTFAMENEFLNENSRAYQEYKKFIEELLNQGVLING